jgi:hypothetical protein
MSRITGRKRNNFGQLISPEAYEIKQVLIADYYKKHLFHLSIFFACFHI